MDNDKSMAEFYVSIFDILKDIKLNASDSVSAHISDSILHHEETFNFSDFSHLLLASTDWELFWQLVDKPLVER